MQFRILIKALVLASVSGCGPSYSLNTYGGNAAQQADKKAQGVIVGVIVGVRKVAIIAVGMVTARAAGGIAGSQAGIRSVSAFTDLDRSLMGGLAGSPAEHVTVDTTVFEYIVRKPNGNLVSVTQKDKTPLLLGQKVLVIAGNQARVVPDGTVPPPAPSPAKALETAKAAASAQVPKPADAKPADAGRAEATPVAAVLGDIKPAADRDGGIAPVAAAPDDKIAGPAKPSDSTNP